MPQPAQPLSLRYRASHVAVGAALVLAGDHGLLEFVLALPAAQLDKLLLVAAAHRRPLVRRGNQPGLIGRDQALLGGPEHSGHCGETFGRFRQLAGPMRADVQLIAHGRSRRPPLKLAETHDQAHEISLSLSPEHIDLRHQAQQLRAIRPRIITKRKASNAVGCRRSSKLHAWNYTGIRDNIHPNLRNNLQNIFATNSPEQDAVA